MQSKGYTVATDRLGSVRWSSLGGVTEYIYFPYGEERTGTSNDTEKFGTYTRDSSGQDYADQRYYGVGTGRFWSVDPGGIRTANPRNPISWNRYGYAGGDPINRFDPTGRIDQDTESVDDATNDEDCEDCDDGGGGGGGSSQVYQGALESGPLSQWPGNNFSLSDSTGTAPSGVPMFGPTYTIPVAGITDFSSTIQDTVPQSFTFNYDTSTTAVSVSGTGNQGVVVGKIGEAVGGPAGLATGTAIGSTIGVGLAVSWVPSTNSWFLGWTASLSPNGTGATATVYSFPQGQNPSATLAGWGGSLTTQLSPTTGVTTTQSPGQPAVTGTSIGTKVPVSVSGGYSKCIWNCKQ